MRKESVKFFSRWLLFLIISIILIIYTFGRGDVTQGEIYVDRYTIILLTFLLFLLILNRLEKISIGSFEAKISSHEISTLEKKVDKLLKRTEKEKEVKLDGENLEANIRKIRTNKENEYLSLLEVDTSAAFAKLRKDLELKLLNLIDLKKSYFSDKYEHWTPIRSLNFLIQEDLINPELAEPLHHILRISNRAIHGERIEKEEAKRALKMGNKLIQELEAKFLDLSSNLIRKEDIESHEVRNFWESEYKVTTIVPLVDEPYKNVYIFNKAELDTFLEDYGMIGEFVISVEKIENDENQN